MQELANPLSWWNLGRDSTASISKTGSKAQERGEDMERWEGGIGVDILGSESHA